MFVLDCSMTMPWAFQDETSPESERILQRLQADTAIAPAVWPLEVCNALVNAQRRGRLAAEKSARFVTALSRLPISTEDGDSRVFVDVLPLALEHGLSSYDAAYLELAVRRQVPLATLDADLARAARAAGVEVLGS
jgi:predicted nucleic acid-binding protein